MTTADLCYDPAVTRGALVVALVGAALGGCGAPAYERSGRLLAESGGLRWSNSPMVAERREPALNEARRLEVTYSVLLDNAGPEPVDVLLSEAVAALAGIADSADCECTVLYGTPRRDVRLLKGRRTRVDCEVTLKPRGMFYTSAQDRVLTLVIPAVRGRAPLVMAFPFRLEAEDLR